MAAESRPTRFRAYQLETAGSSFSYFDGERFTLIEGRYTELSATSLHEEMRRCGVTRVHTLHITSWDKDHCNPGELSEILDRFKPVKVEYPGYPPGTDSAKECLSILLTYKKLQSHRKRIIVSITPDYISSLRTARDFSYNDILYHPKRIDLGCSNDNSTIKQLRSGSFNVLSLGDVESEHIAAGLRRLRTIRREVDVLILAHHGADNGFTTSAFLKHVKPTIAIASSNYGNQHDHPRPAIRTLLQRHDIQLFTTKKGDILIESIDGHRGAYRVSNFIGNSTKVSDVCQSRAKKMHLLSHNDDTLRARMSTKSWRRLSR